MPSFITKARQHITLVSYNPSLIVAWRAKKDNVQFAVLAFKLPRMKERKVMFRNLSLLVLMSMIVAGCGTPAVIKKVEDRKVDDLKASASAKPIQFTKMVVKLKRGEHVGAVQGGLLCVPQGDLTWKGGRMNIDSDEFTEAFKDELEKHSFKTVGDTNALFEDPSTWKSEILVAGLVKELILLCQITSPNDAGGVIPCLS